MVEAVGTVFAGMMTLIAVIAALHLGRSQDRSTRFNAARTAYLRYLDICMDHPEYSSGEWDLVKSNPVTADRYEWFFAILGYSAEEILSSAPRRMRSGWRSTLSKQLGYHSAYIKDKVDKIRWDYEKPVAEIINDIAGKRIAPHA